MIKIALFLGGVLVVMAIMFTSCGRATAGTVVLTEVSPESSGKVHLVGFMPGLEGAVPVSYPGYALDGGTPVPEGIVLDPGYVYYTQPYSSSAFPDLASQINALIQAHEIGSSPTLLVPNVSGNQYFALAVPEPGQWILMCFGFLMIGLVLRSLGPKPGLFYRSPAKYPAK